MTPPKLGVGEALELRAIYTPRGGQGVLTSVLPHLLPLQGCVGSQGSCRGPGRVRGPAGGVGSCAPSPFRSP